MSTRLVSIDVEPGGVSRPIGYVGLAEIVDGKPGTSWCGRFWSPFAGDVWARWAIERAADAYEWWAGSTAEAWSQHEHPTVVDEHVEDWGEDEYPPRRVPEWAQPEPPRFAVVWRAVHRFVGDSPTAAFGAAYDAHQIGRLCAASDTEVPTHWQMLDGRQLLQPLGYRTGRDAWSETVVDAFTGGGNTLEAVQVRLGLLPDVEAAWRSYQHGRWGVGNKQVLHDAEDDAVANAALFQLALRRAGTPDVDQLATLHHMTIYRPQKGKSNGRGD